MLKIFLWTIVFISALSVLTGLVDNTLDIKCSYKTRISYYNPFYRFGCWLTEPYYVYRDKKK